MIEVISEEYRRANKKHECDYCLGDIEKGEFYKVSTLKYDHVYRWKSHRECEFLAGEFHRSGVFEDYGNGMVQEDFEECVEQVHDSFINPEYEHGSTFQSRLKEVYIFLCENKLEKFRTKSYGTAFRAVKRKYPANIDYIQGTEVEE